MYREVSGFFFWRISSENYAIRQFYAKRCRILCRAKRALFAFAQRSGAMKAPERSCAARWRGFAPTNYENKKMCVEMPRFKCRTRPHPAPVSAQNKLWKLCMVFAPFRLLLENLERTDGLPPSIFIRVVVLWRYGMKQARIYPISGCKTDCYEKRENRYGMQFLLYRQVFLLRKRAAALASILVQQPFLWKPFFKINSKTGQP